MANEMGVTSRQLAFLQTLSKLVVDLRSPVHYTKVAAVLGVNRYSAYDMLRVLEDKGLVAMDYILESSKGGPGRSKVVFFPTRQGIDLLRAQSQLVQPQPENQEHLPANSEEWNSFRKSILDRLKDARQTDTREILQDLLSRLPEHRHPLHYCAQMVTALVLNLQQVQGRMAAVNPFDALDALTTDEDGGVRALAGLSLGSALIVDDHTDASVGQQLVANMHGFQDNLHSLSSESKHRLGAFLKEAIGTVRGT